MKQFLIILIAIFLLSSCASGSYVLTGQKRDPINPSLVILYTSPPTKYDVIGIVNASSDMGWTEQDEMDLAVSKLKEMAAKFGANGILLTATGESTSSAVGTYSNGFAYTTSSTSQTITGQAIYVMEP
jgi:predicted ATP-grasp superfamily ATP-dependent carboligase